MTGALGGKNLMSSVGLEPTSTNTLQLECNPLDRSGMMTHVENVGIEPTASCVQGRRSTPELIPHLELAGFRSCLASADNVVAF